MNAPNPSTQDRFTYLKHQLARPPAGRRLRYLALGWAALNACLLAWLIPKSWGHNWPIWFPIVVGISVFVALGVQSDRLDKQQRLPLLDELTHLDDPRAVGLLLTLPETISSWEAESLQDRCPPEIQQALIRLLPRLQRADAVHLPVRIARGGLAVPVDAQMRLHHLLRDENEELVVAVLIALAQVGTLAALPFVEPLTNGRRGPRIQAEAQRCYAVLAKRADKVKSPEMLLRAASAPADTLLRPALPVAAPAAEELLRAHLPQSLS